LETYSLQRPEQDAKSGNDCLINYLTAYIKTGYFDLADQRGLRFDILDRDFLVAQRLPYVLKTRQSYRQFWEQQIAKEP